MPLVVQALRVVISIVFIVAGTTQFGAPVGQAHGETPPLMVLSPATTGITVDEALSLSVEITNQSDETYPSGSVAVYVSSTVISDVSRLENWILASDGSTRPGRFLTEVDVPEIAAGETVTVTTDIPTFLLRFSSTWGPRGLAASYAISGNVQATARSAVVVTSGVAPPPVSFSAISSLTAPPTGVGLLTKNQLEELTGPNGLLTRQLDFVEGRPLLVGVDPMILASITALSESESETITAWTNRLSQLENPTFLLAYADSDISLQAQAGATTLLAPSLEDIGSNDAPDLLTFSPSIGGVGWPVENTVSEKDLSVFQSNGVSQVIVSSGNVSSGDSRPSVVSVQGIPGAVVNESLSSALMLQNPAIAAALLAAAALDSTTSGKIFAAIPRQESSLGELRTVATQMDQLLDLSWVEAGAVTFDSPSESSLVNLEHSAEKVQEARQVLESNNQLALFSSVAEDAPSLTGPSSRNAASVLSAGWEQSQEQNGAVRAYLAANSQILSAVEIVTGSTINMVGGQVNIPVAVRNSLDQAVTVVVTAQSSNARLTVMGEQTVTVLADSQKTAQIPVQANASSGQTTLRVSLLSPTGVAISEPKNVVVEVRAEWESWALGVLIVCFAGLVIVGTVRTIRKNRTQKSP